METQNPLPRLTNIDTFGLPDDINTPALKAKVYKDPLGWDFGSDKLVADPTTGAKKADGAKLRWDLMPPGPIQDIVKILSMGVHKYGDRNWEAGMQWGRPFAASMRHLWAWWNGENIDTDSGCSHLAHAACNIIFLMEYENTHPEMDDRPKKDTQ